VSSVRINADRLQSRLTELAQFGRTPAGGVTRLSYQADHAASARLTARWMREAGAEVGLDAWGNLFGIVPGTLGNLPSLALGSHLDTVPNGGLFDGALGVVAAVEVAAAFHDAHITPRHPLLVLAFAEEEGTSFGVGCLGSLGFVGRAPAPETLRDQNGIALTEQLRAFDARVPRRAVPSALLAYLELHIEQGPILAGRGSSLAAVEAIVGIARTVFTFTGEANHAGTTPMDVRRDALWGAADLVAAVRSLARDTGGRAVGTVGRCAVFPGATNVIPGRAEVTVELRSPDATALDTLRDQAETAGRACAERYGLGLEVQPWRTEAPVMLNRAVRDEVTAAAADQGWSILTMPSWAGHDAKILASIAPTGMIFVPSVGGVSHSPRERTAWGDIVQGAQLLCRAVERLDASSRS
jgi:beta-ureidopropionase / N-carbamoyl-L-amino-acid hydrolase